MTFKKFLLIGMLLFFHSGVSYAQLKIPTFDVELKINQNMIPGGGDENGTLLFLETTNLHAGAHIQINQYIALGGFYSRNFRGNSLMGFDDSRQDNYRDVNFLMKGLDIRLSTGRAKNWRKYLAVNFSQVELVQVNESFRLADKSNAFGGNLGIMRKLSNNLYLNLIELGVKVMSDEIFWFNTSDKIIIDAKMGLTYNIGKRK